MACDELIYSKAEARTEDQADDFTERRRTEPDRLAILGRNGNQPGPTQKLTRVQEIGQNGESVSSCRFTRTPSQGSNMGTITRSFNMTIQDAEPDNQLLDRALPAIARLEASLADEHENSRLGILSTDFLDALTNLGHAIAEESEEMDALNLIAPGMWAAEEFHSRIISWLLDPSAHHQQARHFIVALLNSTLAPPRLLDADWSTAQVCQEWENVVDGQLGYLDILIRDRDHQNLIAIENKVFSQEHSNQLTRYRRALADAYPDFARHHIFLSPAGQSANLERDRKHWQPASYSVIHNAIQEVLDVGFAEPNANALLKIYATAIRRNVMPETNIDRQARRIYLEHWEALDRIFANKPDYIEETKPILREAVAKYPFWKLDLEAAQSVRFRAADWDEFPSTRTGTGWASGSNALLLFQLRFDGDLPYLDLGLSTASSENTGVRAALFDAVRQNPAVFKPTRNSLADGRMILHREPDCILEPADQGPGWDDGTARRKIEAWIDNFAAGQFLAMNRIIVDCLRRHQES